MHSILLSIHFSEDVDYSVGGVRNFLIAKMGQAILVSKSQLPPYLKKGMVGKEVRLNVLDFEML